MIDLQRMDNICTGG